MRTRLFPPQALLGRLGSWTSSDSGRLKLLTGGAKDRPTRQQTLRGAIDWSYNLLDPAEQKLFARLSVFAGGCTLEAVETVCNPEGDPVTVSTLTVVPEAPSFGYGPGRRAESPLHSWTESGDGCRR